MRSLRPTTFSVISCDALNGAEWLPWHECFRLSFNKCLYSDIDFLTTMTQLIPLRTQNTEWISAAMDLCATVCSRSRELVISASTLVYSDFCKLVVSTCLPICGGRPIWNMHDALKEIVLVYPSQSSPAAPLSPQLLPRKPNRVCLLLHRLDMDGCHKSFHQFWTLQKSTKWSLQHLSPPSDNKSKNNSQLAHILEVILCDFEEPPNRRIGLVLAAETAPRLVQYLTTMTTTTTTTTSTTANGALSSVCATNIAMALIHYWITTSNQTNADPSWLPTNHLTKKS